MEKHMDFYVSLMFDKMNLSCKHRELIAVVVSSINNCQYCIKHHVQALNYDWTDSKKNP